MSDTCNKCDKNRHNEYDEPCMECHTYAEKSDALIVVEKIKQFVKHYSSISQVNNPIDPLFLQDIKNILETKGVKSE